MHVIHMIVYMCRAYLIHTSQYVALLIYACNHTPNIHICTLKTLQQYESNIIYRQRFSSEKNIPSKHISKTTEAEKKKKTISPKTRQLGLSPRPRHFSPAPRLLARPQPSPEHSPRRSARGSDLRTSGALGRLFCFGLAWVALF